MPHAPAKGDRHHTLAAHTAAPLKHLGSPADSARMASSAHARTLSPVAALVDGMLDLVPLPQAYVRIREIVEDPAASLRAISEVVTSDPALTGRVLRLANSAFYASVSRVDTVDHAVRILGLSQIHDIALATSAVGSLSRLKGDLVSIFEFWRVPVALHTRPLNDVPAAEQPWVAVVHVAAATARAATWVDAESEPVPDYDANAIALLGVDAERIEALMQETDGQVAEFIAILLPNA